MLAPPLEICPAVEDDFPGFHRCFDAIVREGRAFQFTETPPREGLHKFFGGVLRRGDTLLVANSGSELIGWIELLPRRGATVEHNADLTIALLASHRGRGVGSRLLAAGLDHARQRGVEVVRLQVFASNPAAIRLYERHGFREDGRLRGAVKLPGRHEDYVLMSLELTPRGA